VKIFDIKDLSYSYPEITENALKQINLVIEKGQTILLLGENGSGKTTMLRAISGLIPQYYGGKIEGNIFYKEKAQTFRNNEIAILFQEIQDQVIMSNVKKEIAFGMENLAVAKEIMNLYKLGKYIIYK
jgi:energy-coupling factor transport system ATP-binding protein